MSGIYRGPGGAGDATGDAASQAALAVQKAAQASASAASASASASAAATSATNAATSATDAASSASGASSDASTASTAATNASNSATAAAASAVTAASEAADAASSATNAAASETAASTYASTASTQATNASTSASSAATSASAASSSASSAATSATNAGNSATAASGSASTASTQASNAAASASSAASSATAASSSATSASSSAFTATTQATNASNSASAASTSATNASNSASAASTSATNASTSATNAATSATAAAASYDSFDDRYLGVKSSAPTLDNDGNALLNGALYFDSVLAAMRVYSTSTSTWASIQQGVTNTDPVRHSIRPSLLLDFANTKALDPRITFTRASTGTFYDGKTMVVAEQNLLIQSQTFDNASTWMASNSLTCSPNISVAPDGTTTADKLILPVGTFQKRASFAGQNTYPAGTYALSIYAKAAEYGILHIAVFDTSYKGARFNVSTGTVIDSTGVTSASIENSGSGWYRLSIIFTASTTLNSSATGFWPFQTSTPVLGQSTSEGDGTSGVLVWGAQLEQRSSVTAYTPTTTQAITNYIPVLKTAASGEARFDHNPTTGESLGLLIEEQRTNLLTYSEQFNDAAWAKTEATVSTNVAIAPDGTQTADLFVPSVNASNHYLTRSSVLPTGAGTLSVYAKAGGYRYLVLLTPVGNTSFDLNTGVVANTSAGMSPSVQSVGNGWYRCSVSSTFSVGAAYISGGSSAAAGFFGSAGDGFSGIYIWGAQLEAGSFATSYIPTVASQVTRAADAASMTGTNFSSWYRADEGTLYAEATGSSTGTPRAFTLTDGTINNQAWLKANSTGASFEVYTNGAFVAQLGSGQVGKSAGALKSNDFAVSVNGAAVATDTSGAVGSYNKSIIGANYDASAAIINGTIKKLAYYPKRLTNAELQGLTTV